MDSIVVMGASAGGLETLSKVLSQLPRDFPAPVFVINHMAPDSTGDALLRAFSRDGKLKAEWAKDGQKIAPGRVYVAPADHHMMLGPGKIRVTNGARENRSRPGIDPLFRSAAVAYGNKVIGVVLTGYLDDGTAGLLAIKKCGGTAVIQDPSDADYPDMPLNALHQVKIDHCVPAREMGSLLTLLVSRKPPKRVAPPKDLVIESRIAERVLSDLPSVNALGHQVPFNCPDCGGVLWEMEKAGSLRYRCHTGHAFTAPVLLAQQSAKIQETLWVALRMFEERRNLLFVMANRGSKGYSAGSSERAKDAEIHIGRIRAMLRS